MPFLATEGTPSPSLIFADVDFGVSATATPAANATNLNAAIAAAAAAQTCLLLPAGDIQFNADLVLPSLFTGAISICGLGRRVTRLVPMGGCNGFNFNLSAGTPASNSVEISDLGLVASQGTAGCALKVSYGSADLGSIENQPGSRIHNVAIYGGGWTSGIILQECWHALLESLYLYGNSTTYTKASALGKGDGGSGSGVGITFMGGINNTVSNVEACEFWSQGIVINSDNRGIAGDCQGITISTVRMVECIEGIHAYGTAGGYMGSVFIDGWMIDNGNINVPGHRSIVIDNGSDCEIGQGQGLQNGGDSQIIFNTCKRCSISDDISLENRANTTGPAIQDNNGSGNDLGESPGTPSQVINISTRGFVGTGGNILIAGFAIAGTSPQTVLIRASGPALTPFGVTGVLPDPKLTLMSGSNAVATNTGWGGSTQIAAAAAQVGAFSWGTTATPDSAILTTLQPGNYTAEVAGASGDTGDALVEVYVVN